MGSLTGGDDVFVLVEGDDRPWIAGVYSSLAEADAVASVRREKDAHYEGAVMLVELDGPFADDYRPWLVKRYSGQWLCDFYQHEPVHDYGLPIAAVR